MVNGRFQRVMRVAVSAGLLTMALTPPAVRHSHTDGERRHKHAPEGDPLTSGVADAHVVSGTHHHRHPHSHVTIAPVERQYSRGSVNHLHVAWLGFDFVLPAPELPASSQDDEGRMAQKLVPVFAANDSSVELQPAPTGAATMLFAPKLPSIDGLPAFAALCITSAGAISNRLCDTARHERSGAQLI